MLVLAPLMVGLLGIVIERTMLRWLYKLDHLYGLLLTFGLTLLLEGVFRSIYGVSGQPTCPSAAAGATNLGFMVLPNYRAWVVVASLVVCLGTWFVIEKTRLGAYLRAGTENPKLVEAFGVNVPMMVMLTYGFGVALAGIRRRAGRARHPGHAADGLQPDHRGVRGGGDRRHGLHPRLHRHRPGLGVVEGLTRVFYPEGSNRGVRHHGDRADAPARRPVRQK
jgi:branched-chain amino acid transport system permease protein